VGHVPEVGAQRPVVRITLGLANEIAQREGYRPEGEERTEVFRKPAEAIDRHPTCLPRGMLATTTTVSRSRRKEPG